MKTVKFIFFFLFTVVLATAGYGQKYTFKVLVVKGKPEANVAGKWHTIKVGEALNSTDELKVTENSYIGLVHSNGRPVEVKEAGVYKISALSEKAEKASSTVLSKYTDFVLSTNSTNTNRLAATGAVDRGSHITLHLPAGNSLVFGKKIIFDWTPSDAVPAPYVVRLQNFFDDELLKLEATTSKVKLDLSDKGLDGEENLKLVIASKAKPTKVSDEYSLRKLTKNDHDRIQKQLQDLQLPAEQTAMDKLLLAGFFENNQLLVDAGTAYLEAIEMAPDVPFFAEKYREFLIRNGMIKLNSKK
jgi:hypothetical protein